MGADLFELDGQVQMAIVQGMPCWWREDAIAKDEKKKIKAKPAREPIWMPGPISPNQATFQNPVPWLRGAVEMVDFVSADGKTLGGKGFQMVRKVLEDGRSYILGTVGGGEEVDYVPHGETESLYPVLADVIGGDSPAIVSLGALGDGRGHRSFASVELPEDHDLPEPCKDYLSLVTSHDGMRKTWWLRSKTWIRCANTERLAKDLATAEVSFKHDALGTAHMEHGPKFWAEELGLRKTITGIYRDMLMRDMTALDVSAWLDVVCPKKDPTAARRTRTDGVRDTITRLFETDQMGLKDGRFTDMRGRTGDCKRSLYALHQAGTEYMSHYRALRGSKDQESDRFASTLFGSGASLSERIWAASQRTLAEV